MKKILLTVFAMILSIGLMNAKQLKNFEDLMKNLREGKNVRVVIEYGKCQLISGNEEKTAPNAIGGMSLNVWEYFAPMSIGNKNAFVVSSESKLINYGGFIHNYAKIKISDDNKVKITAQYANAKTFELEMNENFFSTINDGKNDGAVYLYTND